MSVVARRGWISRWTAATFATALVLAFGCHGSGGRHAATNDDAEPSDAGDDEAGSDIDGAATEASTHDARPAGCDIGLTFVPHPWAPPTAWGQAACTQAEIDGLIGCFATPSCGSWFMTASPRCIQCVVPEDTDAGASAGYGPMIIVDNFVDHMTYLFPNFGGCITHFDGDPSKTSCGAQDELWQNCLDAECRLCPDVSVNGPMTKACVAAANADSAQCKGYRPTSVCLAEFGASGIASACTNLLNFLGAWCGPGSSDGGSD